MKQLSGLDATFLYLETAEMPMHVGALHVFELPAGHKGKFVVALRKHIESRLPVAPVLRRRLWWMPLNLANPAWVDADPDLKQHIVEIRLPKGSGLPELEAEVSRLHPVLLDRNRPLWKFRVFENLAPGPNGGRRIGLYTQLHHAAVDGQAAVALANAIMDLTAEPRTMEAAPSRRPRIFRLDMTEMLRGVIGGQAQKVAEIVRGLPATVGTLKDATVKAVSNSSLVTGVKKPGNLALAPRMPMNSSITTGRAFASVSLPLRELKELGKQHEASINDMVLMVCSSALRRYFAKRRALPRKSLIAAVPVSLRAKGDTSADNQASMSLVSLGTHIADTAARLAHVKAAAASMKSTMGDLKSILPTDFPSLGVPWLLEAATALYGKARLADRIPQVANVVISNVPGPPVPLYMAGAKMLSNAPTSIIVHGMGLNITVQSYDQSLDFGLMADAAAMPDVRELADAVAIAFDDLRALSLPASDDTPTAAGIVRRSARRVGGAMTDAMTGAVGGAVSAAVSGALSGAVKGAARAAANRGGKGSWAQTAGKVVESVVDSAVGKAKARSGSGAPTRRRGAG
jgi:WS/DGAT/MGAT family acyltransferase